MKLEPLVEYHADLKGPAMVGPGPYGDRRIVDVTGGTFKGPRLSGTILPSGGDWLLVRPDGYGLLDVRPRCRPTTARSSTSAITAF